MHRANFLHIYQPPGKIVVMARRWQESSQAHRWREQYLRGHAQLDANQLTFSS